MSGVILGLAVLTAVVSLWLRGYLQRRAEERLPGGSPESALPAPRFDDIDAVVRAQHCPCGGRLRLTGEGPLERGPQRLRFVRLACIRCERERQLFFDVTAALS